MTVTALSITPHRPVAPVELPDCADAQRRRLAVLVGGEVDRAEYHSRALLHLHDGGMYGGEENLSAWTLAALWRGGLDVPHLFSGTVILTGAEGTGGLKSLPSDLAEQATAICASVADIVDEWRTRRTASAEAAQLELLAAAQRQAAAHPERPEGSSS